MIQNTKGDSSSELSSLTVGQLVTKLRDAPPGEASLYCREIIVRFEPLLRHAWKKAAFELEYQDFVQEVVVRFFRGLPRLKSSSSFPGFLQRIALRTAIDSIRKQANDPMANPKAIEDAVSRFDEDIIRSIHIKYCLEMLPAREKEVIELEFFGGLSVKEIARRLGLSQTAVRVTKFRARQRLRRLLLDESKKA